eukprot:CAMPEP_0185199300 /NCGR_PEP_ID=MMETSP1140-20130426/44811_1 /TAXON_ID=298111 /ORGANISM="Pavlova sp., Strain CCMP459" /LENGTH=327 /DNA_ID=CAMNT_0027766565 /DNA_START=1 /DNA_END=985 /DNA_ORIENTATION=-
MAGMQQRPGPALEHMVDTLKRICPRVAPDFLPNARSPITPLPDLCDAGPEEAREIAALLNAVADRSDQSALAYQWSLDPARMTCTLVRCARVSVDLVIFLDTCKAVARLGAASDEEDEADAAAQKLAHVNGITHNGALEARLWMQEAYALAYAIKVLARNMGTWTFQLGSAGRTDTERLRTTLEHSGFCGTAAGSHRKTPKRKALASEGPASEQQTGKRVSSSAKRVAKSNAVKARKCSVPPGLILWVTCACHQAPLSMIPLGHDPFQVAAALADRSAGRALSAATRSEPGRVRHHAPHRTAMPSRAAVPGCLSLTLTALVDSCQNA